MTDDHYKQKYINNKDNYKTLKCDNVSKPLHGGVISEKTKENIMYLKKSAKDVDLRVVMGAGNVDVLPNESEDYSRFSSNKYNVAITNDCTLIDFTKRDLIGLCLEFEGLTDMVTVGKVLAGRASHVIFDYSVIKFISGGGFFINIISLLKPGGELIFDQTLETTPYEITPELPEKLGNLGIQHNKVTGKQYINHFMKGIPEDDRIPTNDEIIENNRLFLEKFRSGGYKFEVTKFKGPYPVPKYSKLTTASKMNKEMESVTYLVAKKISDK
jgi:hypothetical protein